MLPANQMNDILNIVLYFVTEKENFIAHFFFIISHNLKNIYHLVTTAPVKRWTILDNKRRVSS